MLFVLCYYVGLFWSNVFQYQLIIMVYASIFVCFLFVNNFQAIIRAFYCFLLCGCHFYHLSHWFCQCHFHYMTPIICTINRGNFGQFFNISVLSLYKEFLDKCFLLWSSVTILYDIITSLQNSLYRGSYTEVLKNCPKSPHCPKSPPLTVLCENLK